MEIKIPPAENKKGVVVAGLKPHGLYEKRGGRGGIKRGVLGKKGGRLRKNIPRGEKKIRGGG